jgi:hypothetical protein
MRQKARIDENQPDIVKRLRQLGASVWPTHQLGDGFPDIIVGIFGKNILFEIKDEKKPPSKKKLTKDEKKWHDNWKGQIHVIYNFTDALNVINLITLRGER